MMLHTYTPDQYPYQLLTSYTLQFPRYSWGKILKIKFTMIRSRAKSRSHHEAAHLYPQPESPPSINFLRQIELRQDFKGQGQTRSKVKSRFQHDAVHLHPPPPPPNFPTKYTLSAIQAFQDTGLTRSPPPPPPNLDEIGKNNNHTTFKGCGIKK